MILMKKLLLILQFLLNITDPLKQILARKMFDALKAQHKIIMLTNADYIESLDVNMWFGNSINFSDCTIINTMIKRDIQDIVTFDRDFEKVDGLHVIKSI